MAADLHFRCFYAGNYREAVPAHRHHDHIWGKPEPREPGLRRTYSTMETTHHPTLPEPAIRQRNRPVGPPPRGSRLVTLPSFGAVYPLTRWPDCLYRRGGVSMANLRGDPAPHADPSLPDRPGGGHGHTTTPAEAAWDRVRGWPGDQVTSPPACPAQRVGYPVGSATRMIAQGRESSQSLGGSTLSCPAPPESRPAASVQPATGSCTSSGRCSETTSSPHRPSGEAAS